MAVKRKKLKEDGPAAVPGNAMGNGGGVATFDPLMTKKPLRRIIKRKR